MAPLTGYRRWMDAGSQLRANSWMLMTGSLGMLASTLPVQWLMPVTGWRALFAGLAVLVVLAMALIYKVVPLWETQDTSKDTAATEEAGYGPVWRNAYFWRMAPVGFFCYAGMLAVQTLLAGGYFLGFSHHNLSYHYYAYNSFSHNHNSNDYFSYYNRTYDHDSHYNPSHNCNPYCTSSYFNLS